MSFRWRLFLGLSTAVLITALSYGLLGYVQFRNTLRSEANESTERLISSVLMTLDTSEEDLKFRPDANLRADLRAKDVRFQVLENDERIFLYGGIIDSSNTSLTIQRIPINETLELELALDADIRQEGTTAYVRTAILIFPVSLLLALALSFALQSLLLSPLRRLKNAVQQLSSQRIPSPVIVPKGRDELSQLAESFNSMTSSIQQFLDRERTFTRYASHELRTPISNVSALVQGMERNLLDPEDTYPQIHENIERMKTVLTGLLELSRSPTAEAEPVLLEPLIEAVLTELPDEQKERVDWQHDKAYSLVMGQDELLEQALNNLISNALKYSEKRVNISLESTSKTVIFRVQDEGMGVPEDQLETLTDAFVRLDKTKKGLGLGLALVKQVINTFDGQLKFENNNTGFLATVSFPKVSLDL